MVQASPNLENPNYRTRRRMDLAHGAYDGVDEARTYFYSANWQVLEEHVDSDLDGDADRIGQQFWGVRYIDDAVAKRLDRDGDGDFTTDPGDNFFYLTDVMFSVRGVTNGSGVLHTRLDYTPYGVAMRSPAVDVTGDGLVDVFDLNAFMTVYNGGVGGTGGALKPGDTGYDPDADLSGSGGLGFFDFLAFQAMYGVYGPGGSAPAFNDGWLDNPADANGPDNSVGYDGYWFDLAGATEATSTGLYMVRHRVYEPKLGRWLQRDPAGYVDGGSLLQYVNSAPGVLLDPLGLLARNGWPGKAWARRSIILLLASLGIHAIDGTSQFADRLSVTRTFRTSDSQSGCALPGWTLCRVKSVLKEQWVDVWSTLAVRGVRIPTFGFISTKIWEDYTRYDTYKCCMGCPQASETVVVGPTPTPLGTATTTYLGTVQTVTATRWMKTTTTTRECRTDCK